MTERDDMILFNATEYFRTPKPFQPNYSVVAQHIVESPNSTKATKKHKKEPFFTIEQQMELEEMTQSIYEIKWEMDVLFLLQRQLQASLSKFIVHSIINMAGSCKEVIMSRLFVPPFAEHFRDEPIVNEEQACQSRLCERIIADIKSRATKEHNEEQQQLIQEDLLKLQKLMQAHTV